MLTTTYTYYEPTESTTSTQIKSIQQTAGTYSLTLSYTYDDNGNILTISDGTNILRYQYGEGNKLTREDDPVAGISTSYLYGENGNPFAELRRPYGDGSAVAQTAYVEYGWDPIWGDMLTSYGESSFTYDPIGNLLSDGTYAYTWEHGRELATMTDSTGTWTFTYDANGMRTGRSRTGSTGVAMEAYRYVYNGSQLSQMRYGMQDINFFYNGEGRPAYFTYNNTTYYYVTNLQGDVIAILDSTGAVMVNYYYDAYGVLLQTGGTMATTLGTLNPLTYRGYVYDHETGLYYLQSRYYDPEIRQFISADDIDYLGADGSPLSYNLFAYCLNNPVNRFDTEGNWSLPNWAKAVIGAVATVAAVAVTVATGGAAAPVLLGVATSTLASGAIGYATGGGQGLVDGLCDGLMWGGIGAFATSSFSAIKAVKTAKQGVAIGEKMDRVKKAAQVVDGATYKAMKGYKAIKKIPMVGQKVADKLSLAHNKAFIKRMTKLGAVIYDTGPASATITSQWYAMERQVVSNYCNYIKMF